MEEAELLPPPPVPKTGTNPTPFETAIQRGHEQMKSKDYPGAIQSFTKAIALRPNYAPAYYSRGVAHQNLEHNEVAIQNYSEAIRLAPDMAPAYAARGVCLVRLHRDPDALIDFQRALELKPGLAFALNGRGGVHFRRKQYRMALADYDAAIKNNPRFAQAYLNRALAPEKPSAISAAPPPTGSAKQSCASGSALPRPYPDRGPNIARDVMTSTDRQFTASVAPSGSWRSLYIIVQKVVVS